MSVISACGIEQTVTSVIETPAATTNPTSTHTPLPPTETPIPMVVIINGKGITREEFESELNRFLVAQVNEATVDRQAAVAIVLDDMISRTLLVQGANENEFEVSDDLITGRVDDLITESGGEAAFNQWLEANGYSLDTFLVELERSIMVAWMRDQILEEVPRSGQQVYLRQIFLLNGEQANLVYGELESGRDFATLADEYDPVTGGELGWVPRNFLPHKEIEEVAFMLRPGEFSQVIETSVGYHIIQVVAIED